MNASPGSTAALRANGRVVPLELPCTLEAFLLRQQLHPKSVVVERNGEAVPPSSFGSVDLQDGDVLEIVRVVAGG